MSVSLLTFETVRNRLATDAGLITESDVAMISALLTGSEYFTGGDNLDAGLNDIQMSVWFRTTNTAGVMLLGKSVDSISEIGYSLWLRGPGGNGTLAFRMIDAELHSFVCYGTTNVQDGDWHLATIQIDRDDLDKCLMYLDGEEETGYTSGAPALLAADESLDNADPFSVGAESDGGLPFKGSICHCRCQIGGTAWTEAQIAYQFANRDDYSSQSWQLDGTYSYWEFDDHTTAANGDADGMITDGSDEGNHLDAVGGTTTTYGDHSREGAIGSISAGSNLLVTASAYSFAVGNGIIVSGAGIDGDDLVTWITEVDGDNFTLHSKAVTTVVDALLANDNRAVVAPSAIIPQYGSKPVVFPCIGIRMEGAIGSDFPNSLNGKIYIGAYVQSVPGETGQPMTVLSLICDRIKELLHRQEVNMSNDALNIDVMIESFKTGMIPETEISERTHSQSMTYNFMSQLR